MLDYLQKCFELYFRYEQYVPSYSEALDILAKDYLDKIDLVKLLNVEDEEIIKFMAKKAKRITELNFGKVILLYAPLYIANFCENGCVYCGFSKLRKYPREKLSLEQMEKEMQQIKSEGIDSILLLTGEDRKNSPFAYIKNACKLATKYFSEVSIEVYSLTKEEYEELARIGVIGITIYQETYIKEDYEKLHLFGPKKDYEFRLYTPERALKAGFKTACIGPLLGLSLPKLDVYAAILHADYLMKKYPQTEIAISFPRLRAANTEFKAKHVVSDKEFIKFLLVARLYLPRIGINLSTRERPSLRDALLDICITKMSAGSKTTVGGYFNKKEDSQGQFEVEDRRMVADIIEVIRKKGLRPEFTNWIRGVRPYELL